MRGKYGIYLLPIIFVLFLIIQRQEQEAAPAASIPLASATVDSLGLTGDPIWFNDQLVGRRSTTHDGWIALERISYEVDGHRFIYAQMDSLAACGAITDTTRVDVVRERSLVRGDSAAVAQLVASARTLWSEQGDDEPEPSTPIFPINTSCPLATTD
jgi:hypothetical protein